jgi:hypothetical protein
MAIDYDPFNPENVPTHCPTCQKKPSSRKALRPVDETTRRCDICGRVERWMKPDRKTHGDRRFQRFLARQRQKFGKLDMALFQWIADPEP